MNNKLKKYILLITYALILFFALKNFNLIFMALYKVFSLLTPFIYGFILAYLLNWPYSFLQSKLKNLKFFNLKQKFCKVTSLILSYIFFFGVLSFTVIIIVPQLIFSAQNLVSNSSTYFNFFEETYKEFLSKFSFSGWNLSDVIENFISTQSINISQKIFTKAFDFFKNFTFIIYNWTIGIIASIHFLFNKDKLLKKIKKLLFVCFPNKYFTFLKYIINLSHDYFGKFIVGRLIDSLIIGFLCFIGTTILNIPYALLISTVVGITNIIPFFGPFLGAIPSILILLVISPIKALTFSIFILILQQIDGNVIGPRILGSSIGVSGMFIMFSVILGGGLFGVACFILGIPIFAVIYTLFGKIVNNKLKDL